DSLQPQGTDPPVRSRLSWKRHLAQFDPHLSRKLMDLLISIKFAKGNAGDARIRDQLETAKTGRGRHKDGCPLHAAPTARRLDNRIGFGVNGSHAVSTLHQVPYVVTVGKSSNGTVVACRKNHLATNDHSSHMLSVTSRTTCHLASDAHEVFVPFVSPF